MDISFSEEEIRIVRMALNEVCNGVDFSDDEFMTRMGCSREEGLALLEKLRIYKK